MRRSAEEVIERLGLSLLPKEGGYYRETYRSAGVFEPVGFPGRRSFGTAIYYLLTSETCSAMHRLPDDEVFHFYLGDPIEMLMLYPDATSEIAVLGPDIDTMKLQHVVPAGTWQGSRVVEGGEWALLGTTMAPGFDFADYEQGTRKLLDMYPDRADILGELLPED